MLTKRCPVIKKLKTCGRESLPKTREKELKEAFSKRNQGLYSRRIGNIWKKQQEKDEEYGQDFIRPVKSQGVREISNSVMTIRIKFTAQPGSHFVIRQEAYKKITEALNAKGINYAHKKVIVDLPGTSDQNLTDAQLKAAGAAAIEATGGNISKDQPEGNSLK